MKGDQEAPESQRPIGFWLKRADELLTARIDEAQRANGLTRLQWQVLNSVARSDRLTEESLRESLKPFATPEQLSTVLGELAARKIVEANADGWRLTDTGRELHARAEAAQGEVRKRAMSGISQEDYLTTLTTVRRLVENLE